MKKTYIVISLVFIIIFGNFATCFAATPAITTEQQSYIGNYVRTYIKEASHYQYVYYNTKHGTELSCNNQANGSGQIAFCCASFCAAMLYQALDASEILEIDLSDELNLRVTGFFNPERNKLFYELTNDDILVPGDIITYADYSIHSLIYIGVGINEDGQAYHQLADVYSAQSGRLINLNFPADQPIRYRDFITQTSWGQVSRLDPSAVPENWEPKMFIDWPGGRKTAVDGSFTVTDWQEEELWYNGIANMTYEGQASTWLEIIVESLGDILDYLIGAITYVLKMPIIAVAQIAETLLNWILQIFSGEATLNMITIEDIIFNQVPLLDVNIFKPLTESSTSTSGINIIESLHQSIAIWYYIFRNVVIIGMLLTLIYLGVRMAITTIAEDKAKYKKLLIDWLVSFIIIFIIHYYIVIVVQGNEFLLGIFQNQMQLQTNSGVMDDFDSSVIAKEDTTTDADNKVQGNDSILSTQSGLFNQIRDLAYSFKLTEGFLGAVAYFLLVYYTIKFCIKYIKRMFNIFILILLSPLIAISYAIDKIKDGKSQSLLKWMKELGFGVFVQSVHALIYTIFVSIVIIQIQNTNIWKLAFSCVLMFITFNFMDKAENLFESIFGMKADSISTATATLEGIATVKSVKGVVKGFRTVGMVGLGAVGTMGKTAIKGVKKIPGVEDTIDKVKEKTIDKIKDNWNEAKYGDSKKNKGKDSSVDEAIKKEKEKTKKQEKESKQARKEIMNDAMKTVGSLLATIPQLADNPAHGISLLIAGITGIGSTRRKITSYKKKTVKTYKADAYAKVRALNARRDAEIQLKQEISNLMQNGNTIVGKGFAEGATPNERSNAVQILGEKIEEALKGNIKLKQNNVKDIVNKAMDANKGKVTQKTLDDIFDEIEKQGRDEQEKISENEEVGSSKRKEKEILEKKEKRNENVESALVEMMTQQALTTSKKSQAFTGPTALMIKQTKEKLQKQLEKEAINSKMSKNETRENLERGLRQELEAFVKKQQEKDAILRDMKKEDLEQMITLAMNSENSILKQLDNDKGIKSTSNEQTNVGSQAGDGKAKVHSNVDMRKKKEKREEAQTETSTNAGITLRSTDFEERLKGEMRPVMEAAEQFRQANEKVQKITRQDSRAKIHEIIGELQKRKEKEG